MGETGILADNPRIELIAGAVLVREPTCSRHAGTVDRLYVGGHPGAAEVLLLDRRVKIPLYARAGIREAWLLGLPTEHVEVFRGRYHESARVERGSSLTPLAFLDLALAADELLR